MSARRRARRARAADSAPPPLHTESCGAGACVQNARGQGCYQGGGGRAWRPGEPVAEGCGERGEAWCRAWFMRLLVWPQRQSRLRV